MNTFRTTKCAEHGHRELTLKLAAPSPIPDLQRILIDYFEKAVAAGTTFAPGQTVRLGWATLRLCDRSDGTIGVEERERAPQVRWTESVDHALTDVWMQRAIVSSVGLLDHLAFPGQDDAAMVADCALDADMLVMTRLDADDLPATFSGWTLACAADHDHGERHIVPLLAIAVKLPSLVQLLALPRGASVVIGYREVPGGRRIAPHVFLHGQELTPSPGSYLAALQSAPPPGSELQAAPSPPIAAPRSFPSHDYIGSFELGDGVVLSDTRLDPPIEVTLACLPGLWHAWVRRTKDGAPAALMAIHEANLHRANDEVVTFGGDIGAFLSSCAREAGVEPTGDYAEVAKHMNSVYAEQIHAYAEEEPEFVARWGGGPVSVMVSDESSFDPEREPDAEGDAGLLDAIGCWARTSTDDNWSIYGVEDEDGCVVVLRVRLTLDDVHKFLIDRKTEELGGAFTDLPSGPAPSSARPYSPRERYAVGETLSHTKFGAGRVVAVRGARIDVMFAIGAKTLAQSEQ